MIELPIGTRFYYNGVLCEVIPYREWMQCSNCVLDTVDYELCKLFACGQDRRKDKTDVFFDKVKESVEEGV